MAAAQRSSRAPSGAALASTELQRRARALGDPTRYGIFRAVAEARRPFTIAELRKEFALNHTTIRQHLAILVEAGLLRESVAPPAGPGRPRLCYVVAPGVEGTWASDGPYEKLARMLLEVLSSGRPPLEVGRDHGRRGAATLPRDGDRFAAMEEGVARRGFEPHRSEATDRLELTLARCPFVAAASDDPAVVCQLHRGLAEGLAEGIGGVEVVELKARSPRRAGCKLSFALAESSA